MRIPAFLSVEGSVKNNIPKKLDLERGCSSAFLRPKEGRQRARCASQFAW